MAAFEGHSAHSGFPGRGSAMRFHALDELGPAPEQLPTPPPVVSEVPPRGDGEDDLPFLTVARAASLIKDGQLSPMELTASILKRIERLNPVLNAYITVTADLALAQAEQAENEIRRGDYRGPLHGIPVALKDLVATAGVLTTGGTGALSDWVPGEDAVVWSRLREAGAILLGKTGLHEMAAGFSNLNPFYGPTRNPWDPSRITGGSSGGSAAAVAGGLCLAAVGSDTAGSIRVPSALCAVTGLKPTFGTVSTRGALYLSWTRDHLGPMTRTAEDAALLLSVMAGRDALNPLSADAPHEDGSADLAGDVRGMRLAVPANYFWDFALPASPGGEQGGPGLNSEVARAAREAISQIEGLGATVSEIEIAGLESLEGEWGDMSAERAFFVEQIPPERRELFSESYRSGIEPGLSAPASAYLRSLERTHQVQVALETALEGYDALLMPASPLVSPTVAAVDAASESRDQEVRAARDSGGPPPSDSGPTAGIGRYTAPFNRSGQPAISVPCGFTGSGLPIGLMVVARRYDDATVLRIAHAYQQATQWHTHRPPLDR